MNDCYHSVFKSQKRIESGRGYSSISLLSLCGSQGTRVRPRGPGAAGTSSRSDIYRTGSCPLFELKCFSLRIYLPRKEVIQPHLPVRLPCYDFTPLTLHTFDASAPRRGSAGGFGCRRLGWCDGRCVQGPGTHSPRHADPRLLATPTSWGRVAAPNPNWGRLSGIRSPSRGGIPLYRPL